MSLSSQTVVDSFDSFSTSFNVTVPANCVGIDVIVAPSDASANVTGVTIGGVALSQISGSSLVGSAGELVDWKLSGWATTSSVPAAGTRTVVLAGGTEGEVATAIRFLIGTGTETEVLDIGTAQSTSAANPSDTLALGGRAGAVFLVAFSGQNSTAGISPRSGWSSHLEDSLGTLSWGVYVYDTIDTADVVAGVQQTAEDILMLAIARGEVEAGGGGGPTGPPAGSWMSMGVGV
ncbi:MAG TPA: hypothetical protein VFO94_19955 [Gammaproteobacteria bacterium]|nr:hypothetical protein [Gammaproteobacteria bacterium]